MYHFDSKLLQIDVCTFVHKVNLEVSPQILK